MKCQYLAAKIEKVEIYRNCTVHTQNKKLLRGGGLVTITDERKSNETERIFSKALLNETEFSDSQSLEESHDVREH